MSPDLWVFGYGSLCWNPGFKYSDAQLGYVRGFKRRFWQGNNSHRGTEDRLGRVVTLIEDEASVVWGKAFQLDDEKASKTYLDTREVALGGYTTVLATFEPLDKTVQPFPVMIYIALEDNEQYLGKASYSEMAWDIIQSKGAAGHNLEYLAKLATFMRNSLPQIKDDHLYLLEQICIFILKSFNSSLLHHFDSSSVEEKWLNRIKFEINNQYTLKKSNSVEVSPYEQSDDESDASDLNDCVCCDLESTSCDHSTYDQYPKQYKDNILISNYLLSNNSLLDSDLFNTSYFYLDGQDELHDIDLEELHDLQSLDPREQRNTKEKGFSDFDSQRKYCKLSIKGY